MYRCEAVVLNLALKISPVSLNYERSVRKRQREPPPTKKKKKKGKRENGKKSNSREIMQPHHIVYCISRTMEYREHV
jgi:hypothetical protein